MTRFLVSVMIAAFVFLGLGLVIEKSSARYKSDERALAVIQRARQAIGGDAAINNVRSMTINGRTTTTFDFGGTARTEQADIEINMQLPGNLSKTIKVGDNNGGATMVEKKMDVFVFKKDDGNATWESTDGQEFKGDKVRTVVIRKPDGTQEVITEDKSPVTVTTTDGRKMIVVSEEKDTAAWTKPTDAQEVKIRQTNDMFRTTIGLLLSAPEGLDVAYTHAGESTVDGAAVDVVDATVAGSTIKLFIDKSTSLPRMISFHAPKPMVMMFRRTDGEGGETEQISRVMSMNSGKTETAEVQLKYSDYRNVGGVLLPHRWTQTTGGKTDVTEITNYAINPANIAEKFNNQPKVLIRKVEKP